MKRNLDQERRAKQVVPKAFESSQVSDLSSCCSCTTSHSGKAAHSSVAEEEQAMAPKPLSLTPGARLHSISAKRHEEVEDQGRPGSCGLGRGVRCEQGDPWMRPVSHVRRCFIFVVGRICTPSSTYPEQRNPQFLPKSWRICVISFA